jgi:hypothetical protein
MVVGYKIISTVTDGTTLTVGAKGCEQIGTRKDEHGNSIPISKCRSVSVAILIADLPKSDKLTYIKTAIETAYAALPDETLVKSLIGKKWTG